MGIAQEHTLALAGGGGLGVPLREIALILLIAALVTFLVTGVVRKLAIFTGAVAVPRERDVHVHSTPRMGGLGMYTGMLAATWVAMKLPALNRGFVTSDVIAVMAAATAVVLVGIIDDRFSIKALPKLIGQITAALLMSALGVSWYLLPIPWIGGGTTLVFDGVLSTVVTVLFTVTLINAMNFIDGLDGLAAGVGLISGAAILIYSLSILHDQGGMTSAYPPAMLSAVLVGACLGFLPHNFSPARIFMGDTGSMLIGVLLAAASTSASGRMSPGLYGNADFFALLAPLIVVIAAFFVPLVDLLWAVVRRMRVGMSPFTADKMHIHHRLLALGHGHRTTVLVIYLWVATLSFSAVGATIVPQSRLLPIAAALWLFALIATLVPVLRRRVSAQSVRTAAPTADSAPPSNPVAPRTPGVRSSHRAD